MRAVRIDMAYAEHVYAAVGCEPPREYRVQSAAILLTDTPTLVRYSLMSLK